MSVTGSGSEPIIFPLLRGPAGGSTLGRRGGGVGPFRPWLKTPPVNGFWEYPDAFTLPQLPKPILFALKTKMQVVVRARTRILPPTVGLLINGITKDKNGTVVVSATVKLYRTLTDQMMETTVSNATTGAFSFGMVGLSQAYYVVAYKVGAPDLAGTTLNTLTGDGNVPPANTSVYLRDPTTPDIGGGSAAYRVIGSPVVRRLA